MADREAAERVLQQAGASFSHNQHTIRVHEKQLGHRPLDHLRDAGWEVQEVYAGSVVLAPKIGGGLGGVL